MKTRDGVICEVLFFFFLTLFYSNMSNDIFEGVMGGIDTKFIMEALTNEVKRMFRA